MKVPRSGRTEGMSRTRRAMAAGLVFMPSTVPLAGGEVSAAGPLPGVGKTLRLRLRHGLPVRPGDLEDAAGRARVEDPAAVDGELRAPARGAVDVDTTGGVGQAPAEDLGGRL